MSHYFIDGYNVIRGTDSFSGGTLRDQRDKLIRFIEEKKPQGSERNRVTLVFDGRSDVSAPRDVTSIQVIYSHGEEADDVIKKRVDELSNPREAVVVTDDRAIQRWVRGVGAKIMSCAAFLAAGTPTEKPQKRGRALDPETVDDINEEFKNIWKLK